MSTATASWVTTPFGAPAWVEVPGVVNMRDLAGVATTDGRRVRPNALLRSDNLNDLTPSGVRQLVDDYQLTDVLDLRTNVERVRLGQGPLTAEPTVSIHPLSLYPEDDPEDETPPWVEDMSAINHAVLRDHVLGLARHYLQYLMLRGDNIVAGLRIIAASRGANVLHCAAGKDRTGTLAAVVLAAVRVPRETIVADYAASNQRLAQILGRLGEAYLTGVDEEQLSAQSTPPQVMRLVLDHLEADFGGAHGYLTGLGWTTEDQRALEHRLLA